MPDQDQGIHVGEADVMFSAGVDGGVGSVRVQHRSVTVLQTAARVADTLVERDAGPVGLGLPPGYADLSLPGCAAPGQGGARLVPERP